MKYLRKGTAFLSKTVKDTTTSIVGGAWDGVKPEDWEEKQAARRARGRRNHAKAQVSSWAWAMFVFAECTALLVWVINSGSETREFGNLLSEYGIALAVPLILLIALTTFIDVVVDFLGEYDQ